MKKQILVLTILVFIIGLLFRLYRFNEPLADWHSWRQADTSAVSRIFAEKGFDILHPKYLDISNIQTGVDNPEGYRFVEFPIYNIAQAAGFKFIGGLSLIGWGRLITIISSLFAGLFLYLFVKRHFSEKIAIFTLIFYTFLPFSIYYGRTILPDTMMVAMSLGGLYFFDIYLGKKSNSRYTLLLISALFTSTAFLLKPYAVFFVLPQIVLALQKYKHKLPLRAELWIYMLFSVLPLVFWRSWMTQFPEGIPANVWLLNGNGIRFRPAFFRWIFYERLTKLILGYIGTIFLLLSFFEIRNLKKYSISLSFLFSSLLYTTVFATGNVQHDYYQILIVPTLSLFLGLGASYMFSKGLVFRYATVIIIVVSWYLSWNQVKDYFNINNRELVKAGTLANEILPKNSKVIAPMDGDTTLLYYINRPGWPAFQSGIDELKMLGATHMVILKPNEADLNGFGKMYEVVEKSSEYLILKL